ncbi:MAG: UDP-N-acetylglucosamine 1-carboxyvinyltransferase [Clostridium sp.]
MYKIVLRGGNKLSGEVQISSAKNAVLPIIAASIMNEGIIKLKNIPLLEDVFIMCNILESIGAETDFNTDTGELNINSTNVKCIEPNDKLVQKLRASFVIMGAMLARFNRAKISFPGGCKIGTRPIDLHLKGFAALDSVVEKYNGHVEVKTKQLIGSDIYLDSPSVGATENIMMAATSALGETIIRNAAKEPEIVDLANFLNSMGASIEGAGTEAIVIQGKKPCKSIEYTPIFDRIEAGTFIVAAAITKSKITINGGVEEHLKALIAKLKEMGLKIESINDTKLKIDGDVNLVPVDIKTIPHPGFPTDMQAQITALLSVIPGISIVTETVFENRFMYVSELVKMGGNIKIDGRSAIIQGVDKLTGAEVVASDLRAGAALILAGLAAEGTTTINDVRHIDRGYMRIEEKLRKLGAHIKRIEV